MSDITITYKGSEIASLSDTGTKNLLTSGKYCEGDITIDYTKPSAPTPTYQAKTNITPTTSSQTITADAGYDALSSVQINAMPSGSASTPATTITANPTITVSSGGLITATASASKSVTPTVSAGYVSAGTAGTVSVSGSNTSQLTAKAAATYTPTTADQTIASGQYLTGTQTILGDANLLAENIKKDVSIFSIVGSYEGGGGGGSSDFETHTVTITADSNVQLYLPSILDENGWPPNSINCYAYLPSNTPKTYTLVFYKGRCYTSLDNSMWYMTGVVDYDYDCDKWYFTGDGSVSMEYD